MCKLPPPTQPDVVAAMTGFFLSPDQLDVEGARDDLLGLVIAQSTGKKTEARSALALHVALSLCLSRAYTRPPPRLSALGSPCRVSVPRVRAQGSLKNLKIAGKFSKPHALALFVHECEPEGDARVSLDFDKKAPAADQHEFIQHLLGVPYACSPRLRPASSPIHTLP